MKKTKEIIADVMDLNPVRRGFILDTNKDVMRLLSGESHEVRQLSCRIAHKIVELFELDDCEVFCLGEDPVSGALSFAVVRILDQEGDV